MYLTAYQRSHSAASRIVNRPFSMPNLVADIGDIFQAFMGLG